HAPIAIPADVCLWPVQGDAVAQEQDSFQWHVGFHCWRCEGNGEECEQQMEAEGMHLEAKVAHHHEPFRGSDKADANPRPLKAAESERNDSVCHQRSGFRGKRVPSSQNRLTPAEAPALPQGLKIAGCPQAGKNAMLRPGCCCARMVAMQTSPVPWKV